MCICFHMSKYVHAYVCISIHICHTWEYLYEYINTLISVHVYTYICTHVYTHGILTFFDGPNTSRASHYFIVYIHIHIRIHIYIVSLSLYPYSRCINCIKSNWSHQQMYISVHTLFNRTCIHGPYTNPTFRSFFVVENAMLFIYT